MKKILLLPALLITLVACQATDSAPQDPDSLNLGMPADPTIPVQEMLVEQNGSSEPEKKLAAGATFQVPEGTFAKKGDDFEGEVFVKGYTTVVKTDEAFCTENCKQYDYVVLNVTQSNNKALDSFLEQNAGNSFAGSGKIGLGCLNEGGKIYYANESAEMGMKDYQLDENLSQAILGATQEAPIILKLSRMPAAGMGAPSCYSHFMSVDQLAV